MKCSGDGCETITSIYALSPACSPETGGRLTSTSTSASAPSKPFSAASALAADSYERTFERRISCVAAIAAASAAVWRRRSSSYMALVSTASPTAPMSAGRIMASKGRMTPRSLCRLFFKWFIAQVSEGMQPTGAAQSWLLANPQPSGGSAVEAAPFRVGLSAQVERHAILYAVRTAGRHPGNPGRRQPRDGLRDEGRRDKHDAPSTHMAYADSQRLAGARSLAIRAATGGVSFEQSRRLPLEARREWPT
jgi:hypothetical protein